MSNEIKQENKSTATKIVCLTILNKNKLFFGRLSHPLLIKIIFSKFFEFKYILKTTINNSCVISGVVYSPDGLDIAGGFYDGTIKIWNVATGKSVRSWQGHSKQVTSVIYSKDGRTIASNSQDNTIKIWLISGECINTLPCHSNGIVYSPDSQYIVSSCRDQTIKIWEDVGCVVHSGFDSLVNQRVKCIAYSPDGLFIATSDHYNIKIWNVSELSYFTMKILEGHSEFVLGIVFSPDGLYLASGSDDNTIKIWNVSTGKCINTLEDKSAPPFAYIRTVAYSPDGSRIISAGSKTIQIWNVLSGSLIQTIQCYCTVWNAVFSPDGKTIVSGLGNGIIKIWEFNE